MVAAEGRGYRPGGSIEIVGGWPLVFLSALVIFIDSVGYGLVVPILPVYASDLGVSEFQVGFLFATYAIAVIVASIPLGYLSDRYGRKPFVLFGMFAMAGAFVFYGLARSYLVLVIARILDGLTAAATWSAALALVGDRFEESEMGSRMGYVMGAAALGGIAGPLIGGVLYDVAGYGAPFYAIAALCFLGGVTAFFLREIRRPKEEYETDLIKIVTPILKNRTILIACLVSLVTTIGFGLLEPTLPLYLQRTFSVSPTEIGLLFGVMSLFFAAGSPIAGKLSDKYGRKDPLIIGLAMTSVLVPLLVVYQSLPPIFVLMALLGITIALFSTPMLPLITDALTDAGGAERGGTAFGLMNLFWSMGYALGPLLGSGIMTLSGLKPALGIYSLLLLLTIGVVAVYLGVKKK